ncbi:uncharacterized protein LOC109793754 [Cajanus cajan]|uniref:uncharacterized protein LOC109793754 n=1 Tax=Cajanus cajan TaxID=3821 RepID=UPI00098D882E|nr:uncharacterized protein LOC109793754 [Cajanus cajan]
MVAYASRQLKTSEKRYPTYDLELVVVVFALKIWRHYLCEEQFDVFGGHNKLKYLFDQKKLNIRQQSCETTTITNEFLKKVKENQMQDQSLMKTRRLLGFEKAEGFDVDDERILRFNGNIYLPQDYELKNMALIESHKSKLIFHPSMTKMCYSGRT